MRIIYQKFVSHFMQKEVLALQASWTIRKALEWSLIRMKCDNNEMNKLSTAPRMQENFCDLLSSLF